MKVEVQHLSPVKKSMSVEVEPEVAARELDTVLAGYASKARIAGFRPGKAPISVVRSHFGREVDEDLRERMVTRYYVKAAKQEGLEPLGNPVLDEVDFDEGRPFRFKTTFEVLPPIEPADYKAIELRRRKPELGAEEVDKLLEELRQSRLQLVPVEGPAEAGHVLMVDLAGTPDEGEPFERKAVLLEVGGESQPAAFAEHLAGAEAGAERQFEVTYPEEEASGAMAGRTVSYTVQVHEVKRKQVPELDDEFARDLGEFDDLAALRAKVEEDLLHRKRHEIDGELRQTLLDKILLANPIVLPQVLVDDELQHRLEQFVRNLIMQGVDPEKVQIDWEKLREQQLEPARKSVHARLILDAIGRLETVEVAAAEVDERIRRDAERMNEKPDKLRKSLEKHSGLQALRNQMLREKALDLLMAVANIQSEE